MLNNDFCYFPFVSCGSTSRPPKVSRSNLNPSCGFLKYMADNRLCIAPFIFTPTTTVEDVDLKLRNLISKRLLFFSTTRNRVASSDLINPLNTKDMANSFMFCQSIGHRHPKLITPERMIIHILVCGCELRTGHSPFVVPLTDSLDSTTRYFLETGLLCHEEYSYFKSLPCCRCESNDDCLTLVPNSNGNEVSFLYPAVDVGSIVKAYRIQNGCLQWMQGLVVRRNEWRGLISYDVREPCFGDEWREVLCIHVIPL